MRGGPAGGDKAWSDSDSEEEKKETYGIVFTYAAEYGRKKPALEYSTFVENLVYY